MKRGGLHLVLPPKGKAKRAGQKKPDVKWAGVSFTDKPRIEYMWREGGEVKRRIREWARPATTSAIAEWVEDYLGRVERGYLPDGFAAAPIPFCARVTLGARVLAEWKALREKAG